MAGSLHSLALSSDTTHSDGILVDVTAGTATITILDLPGVAIQLLGISGRLVDSMSAGLGSRKLGGEDPATTISEFNSRKRDKMRLQICRASVEVQVQGRSTDFDGGQVFRVILLGGSNSAAGACSRLDTVGDSAPVLSQSIGIDSWKIDGLLVGHWSGHLVDSEALARLDHRDSRHNGRETDDDSGDFAKDDHLDETTDYWTVEKYQRQKRRRSQTLAERE